ncbi:MAG: hypothetical protein LBP68_03725 [Acidobacteriota bacterium]|jgi:FSR family fosmidomycin resistance protein-like MFS transporter|nr:hypothetical protein [Acidobacteriota bacterium]
MLKPGINGKTTILSLAHACVDGVCAAALFGIVAPVTESATFFTFVMTYNLLAFPLQALIGLIADHVPKRRIWLVSVMSVFALVWLIPLPPLALVIVLGVCNSMFHVLGGIDTLETSCGKMTRLGIFVAPGAIGLAVGTIFPQVGWVMGAIIALLALSYMFTEKPTQAEKLPATALATSGLLTAVLVLMVLVSVVCRGMGGSVISYEWKTGLVVPILFAIIVAGGKAMGGFLSDRLGIKQVAITAAVAAALLLPISADIAPLALLGQFLVNLTMPVTLMLLYRAMPHNPGFSFGLAAAMLFPGVLLGNLLNGVMVDDVQMPVLLVIFGANAMILAIALYWSDKKPKESCL